MTPPPRTFNINNDVMPDRGSGGLKTYSDYGRDIKYNEQDKVHLLSVATGGGAGCDSGALAYAKPKLDKYMNENNYSSYTVLKGQYSLFPLSQCVLYMKFEK